jgi:hypothetical protein
MTDNRLTMSPEQLLEDYGLRLPELEEERAREAQHSWERHLEMCEQARDLEDYEAWLAEQQLD